MNYYFSPSDNSAKQIVKAAILNTNRYFVKLIYDTFVPIIIFICLFSLILSIYVFLLGLDHVFVRILQFIITEILSLLILFVVSYDLFHKIHYHSKLLNIWQFLTKVSWPWTIESVKVSAVSSLYGVFFLVPGIIKKLQYCFVSFIVFFNPDYKKQGFNALKHSVELSKGLVFWLFFFFLLFPLFVQFLLGFCVQLFAEDLILFAEDLISVIKNLSLWTMSCIVVIFLYIWSLVMTYLYSVLYFIYEIKQQHYIKLKNYSKEG